MECASIVDLGTLKSKRLRVWLPCLDSHDVKCNASMRWGEITLHLAEKYPNAKITGISKSYSQREYILVATAWSRGYNVGNISIITCNVADDKGFLLEGRVKDMDLVMTVEM